MNAPCSCGRRSVSSIHKYIFCFDGVKVKAEQGLIVNTNLPKIQSIKHDGYLVALLLKCDSRYSSYLRLVWQVFAPQNTSVLNLSRCSPFPGFAQPPSVTHSAAAGLSSAGFASRQSLCGRSTTPRGSSVPNIISPSYNYIRAKCGTIRIMRVSKFSSYQASRGRFNGLPVR